MKLFYGLNKNGLWYVTDKEPTNESYIVIEAADRKEAERKLFEMATDYPLKAYL